MVICFTSTSQFITFKARIPALMPSQNAQAIQKEYTSSQDHKRIHKASLDKIILLSHSYPERNAAKQSQSSPPQAILKGLARLKHSGLLYRAKSGFSIITVDCLTFQTHSPPLGRCQFYNSLTIRLSRKINPPTSTAATCRVSHCLTSARRPPGLS